MCGPSNSVSDFNFCFLGVIPKPFPKEQLPKRQLGLPNSSPRSRELYPCILPSLSHALVPLFRFCVFSLPRSLWCCTELEETLRAELVEGQLMRREHEGWAIPAKAFPLQFMFCEMWVLGNLHLFHLRAASWAVAETKHFWNKYSSCLMLQSTGRQIPPLLKMGDESESKKQEALGSWALRGCICTAFVAVHPKPLPLWVIICPLSYYLGVFCSWSFLGFLWLSLSRLCLCEGPGRCPSVAIRGSLGLPPLNSYMTSEVCLELPMLWLAGREHIFCSHPLFWALLSLPQPVHSNILSWWTGCCHHHIIRHCTASPHAFWPAVQPAEPLFPFFS